MGIRRLLRERNILVNSRPATTNTENEVARDSPLFQYYCEFPAEALIREHASQGATENPNVFTNFLGVKVAPEIMPSILGPRVGQKEGLPFPGNWHADIAEWAAALLSVREAKGTYRIIEVGCGWGCWLNNMGVAAKNRGLEIDLIGIEGDSQHLENAKRTLQLNGIIETEFQLTNGVAAPKNGIALFPISSNPGEDWSAEPIFFPNAETLSQIRDAGQHKELQCFTLKELAHDNPIDLLHIDIQGAEMDFVEGNFDDISRLVKRIFIGTHSRFLEGSLQQFFLDRGWALEMDRPAICEIVAGKPDIRIDGALLFRHPSEAPPVFDR